MSQYADFDGRARRKEYWMFVLFNLLIALGVGLVGNLIGADELLSGLYSLVVLIPSLAVAVRRLHDSGKSGWWLLLLLLPIIGFIILIVFLVKDSQPGSNQYGANPKEMPSEVPVKEAEITTPLA